MVAEDDRDRLSVDDARILSMESVAITGHTLKLNILQPAGAPLDIEALQAAVARRLPSQPRATQRVDTSGSAPRWVQATDFDVRNHVRRHRTAAGASEAELWPVVSALMSEHLDRDRPLWTFDVIGPLADGREAIAVRIHHAMADGIADVHFLNAVLWDEHASRPVTAGVHATTTVGGLSEVMHLPGAVLREFGHRATRTPFDLPITASRELAFAVAPLSEMKAIGAARPAHATVNDVLLAVVAGGLREWLAIGGSSSQHLRAQIPVSLHHRDETTDLGNRDSFMNVDLPLGQPDPLARLDQIRAQTGARKLLDDPDEMYDLFHALGRLKYVGSAAQRLAGSAREFSVSISNVPGPASSVSVAGRPVEHLFSSSEPAQHHALRISAISCAGVIGVGLCTDPTALPDIARLADLIERAHLELRSATSR